MVSRVINPKAGAGGLGKVIRGRVARQAPAGTLKQMTAQQAAQAQRAAMPKSDASTNAINLAQAQKSNAPQQKAPQQKAPQQIAAQQKALQQKLTAKPKAPTRGK